jgi:hypothetical protein
MYRLLFPYVLTLYKARVIIKIPIIQEKTKLSLSLIKHHAIKTHEDWSCSSTHLFVHIREIAGVMSGVFLSLLK